MDYDSKYWAKNAYVISEADLLPPQEEAVHKPPSIFDLFKGAVYNLRSALRRLLSGRKK